MGSASFPSEVRAFARYEKAINDDLTLPQIEELEKNIVNIKTADERTRAIGLNLLNRLNEKKDNVVGRALNQLSQTRDPILKIKQLQPLMYYLPPEEVKHQFSAIEMEAALMTGENAKAQAAVSKQLQHLRNVSERPIFQELDENTPNSFAEMAQKVADAVRKSESLAPLKEFNEPQLKEVFRAAARKA